MHRFAATAAVVIAAFFAIVSLGRADDEPELEFDYNAIHLEEPSAVTVPTFRSESTVASTVETSTSFTSEWTLSSEISSNETDIELEELKKSVDRLLEINRMAARDREYQRREVHVLKCCLAEDENDCVPECVSHFVASVDDGGAASNDTMPLLLCNALYELLDCWSDPGTSECMEYCRCFTADPWADAVWAIMSALYFVCMLLTLAAYSCVPRLRNLHGKCLISYLVAVIAGEAIATVSSTLVCGDPNPIAVAVVSYLTLVRYSWVNLLCIDVYWTCRPFQSVRQQPRTGLFFQDRRRFFYLSAAAWGGPAILFGLLKAFEVEYTDIIYAGIIFFLLASSCVPLILTLGRIWRTRRQTKKKCLNISKLKLNWFYLTSKLLCLSGAGKLFSLILYFTVRGKSYYNWLFVILKLEGPIMLFLFVFNVRVRSLVRQRLTHLEWISVEKSNDNCTSVVLQSRPLRTKSVA